MGLHAGAGQVQVTGRVTSTGGVPLQSGATHVLVRDGDRPVVLLRSRRVTLDVYEGRIVQVSGTLRGQVHGEVAPVLEVERLLRLPLIPGPGGAPCGGGMVRVEWPAEAAGPVAW